MSLIGNLDTTEQVYNTSPVSGEVVNGLVDGVVGWIQETGEYCVSPTQETSIMGAGYVEEFIAQSDYLTNEVENNYGKGPEKFKAICRMSRKIGDAAIRQGVNNINWSNFLKSENRARGIAACTWALTRIREEEGVMAIEA